ncbi:MAG TPA: hypothetical protein PKA51_13635, partial [Kiritimatiellia bacterium]|nr:hypothetical protein [Kiritimatiellia bacterium]
MNEKPISRSSRLLCPVLLMAILIAVPYGAHAATFYVRTNGNDAAAGTNWLTAKQTIQAAVDLAVNGDTVLVSNGTYNVGNRRSPFDPSTNRVVVTNNIMRT